MKINELRDLSGEELSTKLRELSEELCRLKFRHGIRPLENTARIRQTRKTISRVKTLLRESSAN